MIISSKGLSYTTSETDRLSINRKNPDWIKAEIRMENTRFILSRHAQNLFETINDQSHPVLLNYNAVSDLLPDHPWAFLGQHNDQSIFVIDLSTHKNETIEHQFSSDYFFEDLRKAGPLSHQETAALLAYGRGLMFWHARHQFCGLCGSTTEIREAGHVRKCLNPDCAIEHFPRTDPAVIMLVHNDDKCLLAHNSRLKTGTYSTLAGFVEPGETLEHAVRREVLEEAGIKVGRVSYAGSQPWPFPTALMMGFYAKAESIDISLDDDELLDAQWFSREDLKDFPNQGRNLSNKDSIARSLIDGWINNPDLIL